MVLKLRWSKKALAKLDSIAAYIAKDNPRVAESFTQQLRQKVNILQFYQLGTAWRVKGTKQYVFHPNYIAIYQLKDEEVQIITILHSAQNTGNP